MSSHNGIVMEEFILHTLHKTNTYSTTSSPYLFFISHHPYSVFSGQWERQLSDLQTATDWLLHTPAQPPRQHGQGCLPLHPGEDPAKGHLLWGAGERLWRQQLYNQTTTASMSPQEYKNILSSFVEHSVQLCFSIPLERWKAKVVFFPLYCISFDNL